jgi:molybdenum cofactor cytidylyltransferase
VKFGPAKPEDALGGVTVHTLRQGALVMKKGTTIGAAEVAALKNAGVDQIVVIRLEKGDVSEDVAAADIAKAVAGDGVIVERAFTGRANLFAERAGILVVDREATNRINNIDEAITFATLSAYKPVVEGEMIATVKLIPFGVEGRLRDAAVVAAGRDALRVAPYVIKRVGVVSTLLPGLAPKVIEKTLRVTAERLAPAGAKIIVERRVQHDEAALAAAIKDVLALDVEMVIVFGASAIADRRDVIPAAIVSNGGTVDHFGMPVDPGNLLLLGRAAGRPVLGAPGCARSPVENGFDWVLMRMLAGIKIERSDITGFGVGGLLMEIVTRPQPRIPEPVAVSAEKKVAAVVLAAGRSTRMGGPNKMLAELNGKPLVRIVTEQALASKASPVIVVTGHQADEVEKALQGLDVTFVRNPDFASGLASSVRAGIAAVPASVAGAMVCLGDMPLIDKGLLDKLIAAFSPERGSLIAVPVSGGRRGNPVLWSRRFFGELMAIDGDIGGRHLVDHHSEAVVEVPVDGDGAFLDIDTPQALKLAQQDRPVAAPPRKRRVPSRSPS